MIIKRFLFLVATLCFSSNVLAYDYLVKKGDTLNEISKRSSITVGELIETNNLKGGQIYIGSTIFIPDSPIESGYASINESSSTEYTGAEGDTPLDIAGEFGVTFNYIKTLNILRKDKSPVGWTRIIPSLTLPIDRVEDPKNDVAISDGMHNDNPSQLPGSEPLPPLHHIVKKGDTLSEISGNFGVTVQNLMQTNGLSNTRLKIGMTLIIPSTGTSGIVRNTTPEKPSIKYIVKDGDSIEELSKMFDIPIDSIKEANYLTDNLVTAGKILILPDSKYEKEPLLHARIVTGITDLQDLNISTELNTQSTDDKIIYNKEEDDTDIDLNSITNRLVNTAMMFLGVPYKFGGNSSSTGLDCSGYVKKVFGILNVDLPRTAREIYNVGKYVQKSQLAIGDLVFFRTYARYPSHVGIYLGDNKFIHASSRSKMVTIDDLNFSYYKRRYIGAKRIESSGLFYDKMSKGQRVYEIN